MVNTLLSLFLLCSCNIAYASGVLVSKKELYPSYIKTPQDIENWLISEGFRYEKDKTRRDEWKTPERLIKEKAGDCEDYARLTFNILEDLGYENVMLIAIYFKDGGHGICWFKEKDRTWSFFSTGIEGGKRKYYYITKKDNPFYILYWYFPSWTRIVLCTEDGYGIKTYHRKDLERSNKK
jgi:hypothetical protein